MNLRFQTFGLIGTVLLLWLWPARVPGQCVIVTPPPPPPHRPHRPHPLHHALIVKGQWFTVDVTDGVAVAKIDQTFANPYPHQIEGTYVFPLNDQATVSGFSMFLDGKEIHGELLDRDQARRTYEQIVARMRDPALLEYVGSRLYKARIFPIPPNGDVRVTLRYTELLGVDAGLATLALPLRGDAHAPRPAECTSVVVNLRSQLAIKNIFSPSHSISTLRRSDYEASVSFEAKDERAQRDFLLHYLLSDKEFGLALLTYRQGPEDGFFMARIAPRAKTDPDRINPKDICFVIDTSGSMSGAKIEQAREALRYCLSHLNSEDRFNIVPFSHEPQPFRQELLPASAPNIEEAARFVDKITAEGGTNIHDSLLTALKSSPSEDASRPYLLVFLTDGLPTVGETQPEKILDHVAEANASRVRMFVFGVGSDVNTKLLDRLAEANRGTREYVTPGESIEIKLSNFYRKVADPVLADLRLTWGGLETYDLFPQTLPDLFSGGEIVIAGRYRGHGHKAIELAGTRRGSTERFTYEHTFAEKDASHDFLPRLWAVRKVGYLLDQIRLHGENSELKEAVVKLARQYGIVTPYTSYLVTESASAAPLAGRGMGAIDRYLDAPAQRAAGRKTGFPAETGPAAVADSVNALQLQKAILHDEDLIMQARADVTVAGEPQVKIRRAAGRTFYWVGGKWVQAEHEAGAEAKEIEMFSDTYFDMLRKHPELAKVLALGDRVVFRLEGIWYEIRPPKSS